MSYSRTPIADHSATQPAPTQIRLLGDPAFMGADGSITALERRAAGLLLLVALEPGVTRARAATLLWPDSDDARRALRQQLSRFRKTYSVDLVVGSEALFIANGVVVDALQVNRGALLGDLCFDDCEDFAEWLRRQRAQRRSGTTTNLAQQIAAAESQGDLDGATVLAEQLLLADDDCEAHHRTLIRLYYLRGDIVQAQIAYDRLARMLRTRFGAQPSAETEQLAQAIRAARPAVLPISAVPTSRSAPVMVLRPPRMIGRSHELAALEEAWQSGRPALLLGEPGLGKTRLLTEFATHHRVLTVQGRPGDAGIPYATLSRLLRTIFSCTTITLPAARHSALARLLPELAPSAPHPTDGQPLLLRSAIEDVLAQTRTEGSARDGVIVDDLHFADDASLEMLQALICSSREGPLAGLHWALAQRPGEGSPATAALRTTLDEAPVLCVIALKPLSVNEMAELIDSLGLPELDSGQLAPQLARHTGGNPLFALETLKQGLASGLMQQGRLPTPLNVGALIERRLKQLPERALALARVAAIAGVDFSIELAEQVMGMRAVELADAWAELEAAQVLRDNAFAHDLVHEAVLRSIPAMIAQHLHVATAAFLEAHGAAPGRLAEHWVCAGRDDRAGPMLVEAAAAAYLATRPSEAAATLERALALPGWTDSAGRFTAAQSYCEALFDVDMGVKLSEALNHLDTHALTEAQRALALRIHAQAALYRGNYARAHELGQKAADAAARLGEEVEYLIARSVAARATARAGATAEAIAMMRSDAERAQKAGEGAHCDHSGVLAILLQLGMRIQESQIEAEKAITLARQLGRWYDLVNLIGNQAANFNFTGRFEDALSLSRESLQLAEGHELRGLSVQFTAMNIASSLIELNRYSEAWAWIQRAEADVRQDTPAFVPMVAALRARWYLELGQGHRAGRALDADPEDASTPAYVASYRQQVRACIEFDAGRDPNPHIERALELASNCGRQFVLWEARLNAAALQCAALAGDLGELACSAHEPGFVAHEFAAHVFAPTTDTGGTLEQLIAGARGRWIYHGRLLLALLKSQGLVTAQAARLHSFAADWLHRIQRTCVPDEFRDAFLHRNPVNLALLDAVRRYDRNKECIKE